MYCGQCGTALRAGAKFCHSCGSRALTVSAEGPAASGVTVRREPQEGEAAFRASAQRTDKGPLEWCLEPWKKYADFRGRARRKEYWFFTLSYYVVVFVLTLLEELGRAVPTDEGNVLAGLFGLAAFVPFLAVGVRRMHDTDHRGWWLLFPLVNLIFLVSDGTRGENRFGADPKIAITAAPTLADGIVIDEGFDAEGRVRGPRG